MARDSGRYDATTDTWIDDNVRIDFAWGNIPIQPNDDRDEGAELDPELDSHIIATDGWSSFPEFEPNVGFDIQAVIVPNVVDFDSVSAAEQALLLSELVLGTVTTSTEGATTGNWGWVKSQNPAASTSVAPGTAVNLVSYEYVSTATTGSVAGFTRNGGPMGWSLNGNQAIMFVTGRSTWPAVGSEIDVTGTSASTFNQTWTVAEVKADDSYNTGGTAIKVTASGSFTGSTSSGGTWAFPVTDIIPATTNWAYTVGNGFMGPNDFFYLGSGYDTLAEAPVDLVNSPASFSLVFSGADGWGTNGSYAIQSVSLPQEGSSALRLNLALQAVDANVGTKLGSTYDRNEVAGDLAAGSFAVTATSPIVSAFDPTTNWTSGMGVDNKVRLGTMKKAPDALSASPTSYKLVVTGGSYAGDYAITEVVVNLGVTYINLATHLGNLMMGSKGSGWTDMSMGQLDGGTVQIVPA